MLNYSGLLKEEFQNTSRKNVLKQTKFCYV